MREHAHGHLEFLEVASAITGASRPEQVDENSAASGHAVAPELFESAERIIGRAAGEPA